MSLSKLQEMVKDRETWSAAVQRVTKSRTHLGTEPGVRGQLNEGCNEEVKSLGKDKEKIE